MRCHSVLLFACSNGMKLPSKSLILRVTREKFFLLFCKTQRICLLCHSQHRCCCLAHLFELTMFILLLVFAYRCYLNMTTLLPSINFASHLVPYLPDGDELLPLRWLLQLLVIAAKALKSFEFCKICESSRKRKMRWNFLCAIFRSLRCVSYQLSVQ